jgi:hypothetical protein
MARGIHLKELRSADLEAIGVPDDGLPAAQPSESGRPLGILAEADPVLSGVLGEVQQDLEDTLRLLEDALRASTLEQTYATKTGSNPTGSDPD